MFSVTEPGIYSVGASLDTDRNEGSHVVRGLAPNQFFVRGTAGEQLFEITIPAASLSEALEAALKRRQ